MRKRLGSLVLIVLAAAATVCLAVGARPDRVTGEIVFVQVPPDTQRAAPSWPWLLTDGGRLAAIAPDAPQGVPRQLVDGFHSVAHPSPSSDATRLVFAGKRRPADAWQIWEAKAVGGRARQVTEFDGDCATPRYAPDNGPPSAPCYRPDQRIVFAGRPGGPAGDSGWQLFSIGPGDGAPGQLTHGLAPAFDPDVLADGRIVFASWQRHQRAADQPRASAVYHMQQDGTGIGGLKVTDEGPRFSRAPVSDGERLFFVAAPTPEALGGELCSISLAQPDTTFTVHSRGLAGVCQAAYPLGNGRLVLSYRPADANATFGLYEFDWRSGELVRTVYDDPRLDDVCPVVARPRTPPHGHVTVMVPEKTSGELYCVSVYDSQLPALRNAPHGSVRSVRVYGAGDAPRRADAARRVLGDAPVEADGSFFIEVPADTPVQLELIGAGGKPVAAARQWFWVRPFEHRGCVGCHAPRHQAPDNRIPQAVTRKPTAVGVERKAEIVGFREKIMPMIERRCATAACHGTGGMGSPKLTAQAQQAPDGTQVNQAYASLVHTNDPVTERPRWVYPGEARRSPLLMVMSMHARTDRVELSEQERMMLIDWMDTGAHWDAEGSHAAPPADLPADTYAEGAGP